jgi:hypothetical protein
VIQWVIWIWLIKQIDEAVNYGIDIQNWFPVFTENVEANISFKVYVWVIDFVYACDLWRIVWLSKLRSIWISD